MNNVMLSDGEWKLMNLLWDAAPRTIGEMVNELREDTGWTKATVNIMLNRLSEKGAVRIDAGGKAKQFYPLLRHDEAEPLYNPSFRQLIHVSFKVAAELSDEYIPALERSAAVIGREIEANIGERHVKLLFT